MKDIDIITIEVGSTVTKIYAIDDNKIVAHSSALTTPQNIMTGVEEGLARLKQSSGLTVDNAHNLFAMSSAAGGLRMTVHGLTRELTTKAAEEAALGAGANIKLITAGKISERNKKKIENIRPNLIMLAGGVEYGEEDILLENAEIIAQSGVSAPVVYAGNSALKDDIREIFSSTDTELYIVDNIYPTFDEYNVQPVRELIQRLFAERLVIAPGMEQLRDITEGNIMPVPAACLSAAELLAKITGDIAVIDIGGATTDVHSVINTPSEGNLEPQIRARRTVEGDLGLFVSAESVCNTMTEEEKINISTIKAVPESEQEREQSSRLSQKALELALLRHSGKIIQGVFLSNGKVPVKGRDLRSLKLIVGTGGGLTRLDQGLESIKRTLEKFNRLYLLPGIECDIRIDTSYIFSSCGLIAEKFPDTATSLMLQSIGGWDT